ncbi:MAG: pyridoxal phosphate-dependent aminotransferase [Alcaligenaceae bacterium]|nr:pyridoxal phosphate-dependent aminotransferase [Alcaligenaceae bacterium]
MKTIQKSERLNSVAYDIRGAIYDKACELEKAGEKIIKLNIGNPAPFGFDIDPSIMSAVGENLHLAQGYVQSQGIEVAREAIADYYRELGAYNVSANDIFIGNGASDLILMAFQGLLNPGDEVLIPAPDYPLWTAAATLAGGKVVHYVCDEEADWNPDIKDIQSKVTDKTKAIVLINPNNPTGAVYSKDVLEQIADVARKNSLILFADEIYDQVLYDGAKHNHMSVVTQDIPVFTMNGLSKNQRATGFRQGWMTVTGPKDNIQDYLTGLRLLASMRLCGNVATQYTIPAALKDRSIDALCQPGGRLYDQSRTAAKMLNDIPGISCKPAQGALYLFPKMDMKKFNITDDGKVILDLLIQEKVLLVKGTGFNWKEHDHFRVVTLAGKDLIADACTRMANFFDGYRQS